MLSEVIIRIMKIIVSNPKLDSVTNDPEKRSVTKEAAPFHMNAMVPSLLLGLLLFGVLHL